MTEELDLTQHRICVTGGAGFLGRAVCRQLESIGVPKENVFVVRSDRHDLQWEGRVWQMFQDYKPSIIIHLAAVVGGIGANQKHPGEYFFANLSMGMQLIEMSRRRGLRKFVQVGTVCSYPKFAPVPFKEEDLWNGYPEETNAPYGIAKKALYTMLDAYHREYGLKSAVVIPTNLYGPGDNFDQETSHVIPAMIRRFCEAVDTGAKSVTCWGSGNVTREFLHVDDAARGVVAAAIHIDEPSPLNLGAGSEISIKQLSKFVADACDFEGEALWDCSKPDGQPRRSIDSRKAYRLLPSWDAFENGVPLYDGIHQTVQWYREHKQELK